MPKLFLKPTRAQRITAATGQEGKVWEVMVIQAGISQNTNPETGRRYFYEPDMLKKKVSLFDGLPAYAFEWDPKSFSQDGKFTHIPNGIPAMVKIAAGIVKNIVGWYSNPRWGKDDAGNEGIICTLTLTDDKTANTLKQSWDAGLKNFLGYSIDGGTNEPVIKNIGGQLVDSVEITFLDSTDIVKSPAMGGKTLRLVASNQPTAEGKAGMEKLLLQLAQFFALKSPDALRRLLESNQTDADIKAIGSEELKKISEQVVKEGGNDTLATLIKEALSALETGNADAALAKLQEALASLAPAATPPAGQAGAGSGGQQSAQNDKAKTTPATNTPANQSAAGAGQPVSVTELEAKVTRLTESISALQAVNDSQNLNRLVNEANLPTAFKTQLITLFAGQPFDQKRITEAITGMQTAIQGAGFGGGHPPTGWQNAGNVGEGRVAAWHSLVATMRGEDVVDPATKLVAKQFHSLREAAFEFGVPYGISTEEFRDHCSGEKKYDSGYYNKLFHGRMKRLTESVTTGTWSTILGDVFTRQMIDKYNMPQFQEWRKVVSRISNPKDFNPNKRYRYGGYNILPVVGEKQPYQPMTTPSVEKVEYSIAKRGGLEALSLEALAADDLGAVREIPNNLGMAAAVTLFYLIMETLRGAGGAIFDSYNLYDNTNHGNDPNLALDRDNFATVRKNMRKKTPFGTQATAVTLSVSNEPKTLWVATTLLDLGEMLVNSPKLPQKVGTGAAGFATGQMLPDTGIPNPAYGRELVCIDYWDAISTTLWVVTGDPKMVPMIELGFWEGRQEPELFSEPAGTGSNFSADTQTYKVRHAHGHCVLDPRSFQRGKA